MGGEDFFRSVGLVEADAVQTETKSPSTPAPKQAYFRDAWSEPE